MKKLLFISTLLTSMAISLSACETLTEDKSEDGPSNVDGDFEDSSLTPGEHKARLEEIAIEFVEYFDANDTEELVDGALSLAEYMEDFDYYGDEPYRLDAKLLAQGAERFSAQALAEFATRAAESFVIDVNDPDLNPFAGKCFTYDDYEWRVTDGSDKTIQFVWDDCVATISWTKSTKLEYYYSDDDINYVVYVPNNIELTVEINGKRHLNVELATNISNMKTWAPQVTISLNGGYEMVSKVEGNSKGLTSQSTLKKDGKTLYSAVSTVAINDATDIDNWMEEYYDEYYDEYGTYISEEYFLENVKTGAAQIDILSLSILAEGDFRGMYQEIESIDDRYDSYDDDYNYISENVKKECEAICKYVNDKVQVVLVYNDTKEIVADVVMSVASEYDSYDDDYYYYVEPILLFPDESKYAFEDYFTERAFGNLIRKVEELAEDFANLVY